MDLVELGHGDAAHVYLEVPLVGLVAAAVDGRGALLQTGDDLHCGHADLLVVEGDIGAGNVAPRAVPHHLGADAG